MTTPVTTRRLDAALLPAFLPYLIPPAAEVIAEGREEMIALGAVTQDLKTCGAIVGELRQGRLTVFSLYVDPAARRQGVGTLLLEQLLALCPQAVPAAEWMLPQEDFDAVDAFLQARGFAPAQREASLYRLESAQLRQISAVRRAFSPTFRPDGNVVPISALTPEERHELYSDPTIDPRLQYHVLADRATPSLCLCYRYQGRVTAYLLCGETGPGEMAILAALSRPSANPAAMLQLATALIHQGLAHFGGDFVCWLDAIHPASENLALALSGHTARRWVSGSTTP